jgi:hypothetical protein
MHSGLFIRFLRLLYQVQSLSKIRYGERMFMHGEVERVITGNNVGLFKDFNLFYTYLFRHHRRKIICKLLRSALLSDFLLRE